MFENKKGQGLSVNTVIILILAIFVLVLVVLAVTGGFSNFSEWTSSIFGGSGLSVQKAALKCNGYCNSYETTEAQTFGYKYCNEELDIDSDGDGEIDDKGLHCDQITDAYCAAILETVEGCAAFNNPS